MKLLLVLVSVIAVFTSDPRDFPDKPDRSDTIDVDQHWVDGQPSTHLDDHFANEPELHVFTDEDQELRDGSLPFADEPQFPYTSELDQQQVQEGKNRIDGKLRGSKCESSVICSILGGSCISNAIHCSGWLVSEGCNGTNCKCCIPGSLEIKTNNIGVELQALKIALDISSLKLESAMENITNTDSDFRQKFQNLTEADSEIKMELQSIKKSNSNLELKLDFAIEKQGCLSDGLFWFIPSQQCYKYIKDKSRNWNDADTRCRVEGLQLAKPKDPIAILKYLVQVLGVNSHVWIGAQGDGTALKWQRDNQTLSNKDPAWYSGFPGNRYSNKYCLNLLTTQGAINNGRYYYCHTCSSTLPMLCEMVIN